MTIEIANLKPHQQRAIEEMLSVWEILGDIGSSQTVCFYADGDDGFRPTIKVNGRKPRQYPNRLKRFMQARNARLTAYFIDQNDEAFANDPQPAPGPSPAGGIMTGGTTSPVAQTK